jgi:hypothetical protein
MPQFSDDLFLGSAQTYMGTNTNSNLGDPSPMDLGVGPVGRIYVWDTVPAAAVTNNLVASTTPAAAGSLTLRAGTSVTAVITPTGGTAYQFDVPRAVSVTQVTAGTSRVFTVTGTDYYGQALSEAITSTAGSTVNGKKAFFQVSSISVSGGTTTAVTVGSSDVLGSPVRFSNKGYIARVGWNDVLAEDAATVVDADATTATTTTGDVRGTVTPSGSTDGAKRLVVAILLTGIQAGPNATRAGALGVNQNLVS